MLEKKPSGFDEVEKAFLENRAQNAGFGHFNNLQAECHHAQSRGSSGRNHDALHTSRDVGDDEVAVHHSVQTMTKEKARKGPESIFLAFVNSSLRDRFTAKANRLCARKWVS